jgi:ABC-type uncharacterized transport system involved in gliding motility auxiliary subunit
VKEPNLATVGLAEPRGTITFHTEGADKPVVLQIGDAPKEKKPVSLQLNEQQLGRLALTVLIIIPCIVGLIGFATWWQRRA